MYFLPLPHGHGSLRPTFSASRRTVSTFCGPAGASPCDEAHARRRSLLLASLHVGDRGGHRRLEVARDGADGVPPPGCACAARRLRLHLDAHQLLDDVGLHAADQLLEQVVAFLLVLLQRVLLAVAAQPDALLQVVHAEEVVAPQVVERLQPDDALEVAHHRRREGCLALRVRLAHALDDQLLDARAARVIPRGSSREAAGGS